MSSVELLPILVVGGGPVGLSFSIESLRYGIPMRTVDKAAGTKDISKALILHVRTQELLDAAGLSEVIAAHSHPMRRVEIIGYGKHIGHGSMEGINSPIPYPAIIGQNVTERLLLDRLRDLGGRVEWQTEAVHLEQKSDHVEVTLRRGTVEEIVLAQYVVGADGTHSKIRESIGIDFSGYPYTGQAFIQSDSKIAWSLPRGSSYLWFTELGYMMVIEMPNGIVRTFISVPDRGQKDTTLEEVNETLNRLGGVDAKLYDPTWVALFRTNHRAAPQFRDRRVFLAGDAGHEHVPIGGQGMNTGIQDAVNLAWKLASVLKGAARPAILDSYNAERHPVAENLLQGTDEAYTRLLKAGDAAKHAIRMFGPYVFGSQTVRETIRDVIEEININYRKGPLSEDHGGSEGPHAGDRALDAEVVSGEKIPFRLRELFRGLHFTFLGFTGKHSTPDELAELDELLASIQNRFTGIARSYFIFGAWPLPSFKPRVPLLWDRVGRAHDQYGVSKACIYVVRPDQYIGFRGPLAESSQRLESYLSALFLASS